jgi:hypothetical protein
VGSLAGRSTIGLYTNFQGDSEVESAMRAFRGNHDRMVELKNTYDPKNLFQLNANVKPTV